MNPVFHIKIGYPLLKMIFSAVRNLFNLNPDPLDELLIEQGKDPDSVMKEVYFRRMEEGSDSGTNRALDRYQAVKDKTERIKKSVDPGSGGTFRMMK